jgi:hypothetical protein
MDATLLEFDLSGEIWHWRGPSPYHFVSVPAGTAAAIRGVAAVVTYGWGMIPVEASIGETTWTTAMFPKDGGYVLPVKDRVRHALGLGPGDLITVHVAIRDRPGWG